MTAIVPTPKRQRTGAVQNASRIPSDFKMRASVLDCGGPPPLWLNGLDTYSFDQPCDGHRR